MGIHISHADGKLRSATTIANLGQRLAHALPARDWRQIKHLFGGRFADVARIPHRDAGKIATIVRKAANDRSMPRDWANLAHLIADAAQKAANSRQDWVWS